MFVLGTSHPLQCGSAECGKRSISLLEQEIRRTLSEHGIKRIAEEMSDDGLRKRLGDGPAHKTLCQRIGAREGIPVDFVDLGIKERACLSLSDVSISTSAIKHAEGRSELMRIHKALSSLCGEVRERVWVARVLSGDGWPVLFVCGANHVDAVGQLFGRAGVEATIVCRDFDPEHAP